MADEIPGLYQMAINPQTGGQYDPKGLLMNGPQYHELFDPSGMEDVLRTASMANAPDAPWTTQAQQGPSMGSEIGFGESGQPLSAGAPPRYSEQGTENVFPSIFSPRAPRSGLFNLSDYYKGAPTEDRKSVPQSFSTGSNALSTNDWRLLPPQYRSPNYFMINGHIIDRNKANVELSPFGHGSQLGAEAGALSTDVNRGSLGIGGHPRVFFSQGWNARSGYPGQLGSHSQWATDNY
jgi:hypothetical protein